jgi:hypothetical protein
LGARVFRKNFKKTQNICLSSFYFFRNKLDPFRLFRWRDGVPEKPNLFRNVVSRGTRYTLDFNQKNTILFRVPVFRGEWARFGQRIWEAEFFSKI